jgi:hypothetical protein
MKKKILTTAKSKEKSSAKPAKRAKKRRRIGITRPYGFLIFDDGTMETKEERKKRLARLEALTQRFFQMVYEDYHRK